jgi:hypothetical protein
MYFLITKASPTTGGIYINYIAPLAIVCTNWSILYIALKHPKCCISYAYIIISYCAIKYAWKLHIFFS